MAYYFDTQEIDHQPGHYYVSIIDADRHMLALGPFQNHMGALLRVQDVRKKANELNFKAAFYGFGTARVPIDQSPPIGKLNDLMDKGLNTPI